jgi:surface protein
MACMFFECSGLTSLDLSPLDTSNVTDMSCMFLYCNKLSVLNLYGLDTTNVTNMMQMFQSCSNLKTVLMDGDMSNVTDARQMFSGCTSLTSVVLFSANKIQPTSYSDIFSGITTAGTLYLNRSCAPPSFIGQIPTTWTYKALTSSPSPDYFS